MKTFIRPYPLHKYNKTTRPQEEDGKHVLHQGSYRLEGKNCLKLFWDNLSSQGGSNHSTSGKGWGKCGLQVIYGLEGREPLNLFSGPSPLSKYNKHLISTSTTNKRPPQQNPAPTEYESVIPHRSYRLKGGNPLKILAKIFPPLS